jgi:hypothetical protein
MRIVVSPYAEFHLLSGALLLDVHRDPLDFEYRIIGQDVVARLGRLKGKRVRDAWLINVTSSAYRNYCAVVEAGAPHSKAWPALPTGMDARR